MKKSTNFLENLSIKSMAFILIAIVLLRKFVFKGSSGGLDLGGTTSQDLIDNDLASTTIKPSYSWATYVGWADYLEKCMGGVGTLNVSDIVKIFSYLHNEKDFALLNKAFGLRDFPDNLFGLLGPASMVEWLNGDLDKQHIDLINSYLKTSGIKARV